MKKLLTIFGTLLITTTVTTTVVSCGLIDDKKTNGSDILGVYDIKNLNVKIFAGETTTEANAKIKQALDQISYFSSKEIKISYINNQSANNGLIRVEDNILIETAENAVFTKGTKQLVAVAPTIQDVFSSTLWSPNQTLQYYKDFIIETLSPFINQEDDIKIEFKNADKKNIKDANYELEIGDTVEITPDEKIKNKLNGSGVFTFSKYELPGLYDFRKFQNLSWSIGEINSLYEKFIPSWKELKGGIDYTIDVKNKDGISLIDQPDRLLMPGFEINIESSEESNKILGSINYVIKKLDLRQLMTTSNSNMKGSKFTTIKSIYNNLMIKNYNALEEQDYTISLSTKNGDSVGDDYTLVEGDTITIKSLSSSDKIKSTAIFIV